MSCSTLFLGKNAEKRCHFLCEKVLIISVGLGNCGKGAGNGSFERDSLSYSPQRSGFTFFLLICPALFHCSHLHGVDGKG